MTGIAQASLFGGNGSIPVGYRLTRNVLTNTTVPVNHTFTFIQEAGSWVSYDDFDQMRFFDESRQFLFAVANFPIKNNGTPTTTTTKSSVSTLPTSSSSSSSTPTESNSTDTPAAKSGEINKFAWILSSVVIVIAVAIQLL